MGNECCGVRTCKATPLSSEQAAALPSIDAAVHAESQSQIEESEPVQSSKQVEPQEMVEMTFAADVSPNISCTGEIRVKDEAVQEEERKLQDEPSKA